MAKINNKSKYPVKANPVDSDFIVGSDSEDNGATVNFEVGSVRGGTSVERTSDLINDGADSTSTYVETDELGAVAFSNDYNGLDNKPVFKVVENEYPNISDLYSGQVNQTGTFIQYVLDATGFPDVTSGSKYFEYLGTTNGNSTDYRLLSDSEAAPISTIVAVERPYKVYTALLTQSGTNAPTAIVLENTLGGTVVWSRSSQGVYLGTLSGAFTSNKTVVFVSGGTTSNMSEFKGGYFNSTNDVVIKTSLFTGALSDDVLKLSSIEIRVYK